jgi:O-antigen biosynthesis protein WbqP
MYANGLKRGFDIVAASLALLVFCPVMLVTAVIIVLGDGGPALFRQGRIGRGGQLFTLLKFRSMPVDTAHIPSHKADQIRVTPVGRVIRRTNLDELPQLINILLGEMSIVGPRPALASQSDLLALRSANGALNCRPGLTGLAQINSFDGMPASAKAKWDGRYADHISFAEDLKIILGTFRYLLKPPPVY